MPPYDTSTDRPRRGYLKVSLVNIPVKGFSATESARASWALLEVRMRSAKCLGM